MQSFGNSLPASSETFISLMGSPQLTPLELSPLFIRLSRNWKIRLIKSDGPLFPRPRDLKTCEISYQISLALDLFYIFALNIYLRKALQSSSASLRRIVSFGRFSVERRFCLNLANSVTRATLCEEFNPMLNPISLRKCFASTRILFTPSPKVRWWAVLLRKETKISTQPERTNFLH